MTTDFVAGAFSTGISLSAPRRSHETKSERRTSMLNFKRMAVGFTKANIANLL